MPRKRKTPICPQCGSKNVIPIVYGYPSYKLWEEEEKGNLKLGGCEIDSNNPEWHCKDCKYEWKELRDIY
ncbi:MAG: hypothetical protein N2312_01785 [Dictyoglomaceae bacterium]|nr:hypothetical protein [Dictyoglomaceae bacterium]